MSKRPETVVYFVRAGEAGPIKIGITASAVSERIKAIQSGCPWRINLIGSLPGRYPDENALHRRFAQFRMSGEWFRPEVSLLEAIDVILRPGYEWPKMDELPELPPIPELPPREKLLAVKRRSRQIADMARLAAIAAAEIPQNTEATLREINEGADAIGMAPTTLCQRAVKNGHLVDRLREGGGVTQKTAQKIRDYITACLEAAE